jgi:hypothetical protein
VCGQVVADRLHPSSVGTALSIAPGTFELGRVVWVVQFGAVAMLKVAKAGPRMA